MKNVFYMVMMILSITACNWLDPYQANFEKVKVGDSKESVVEIMGKPTQIFLIALPLDIEASEMEYKAYYGCTYTITTAMNHVISKAIVQCM